MSDLHHINSQDRLIVGIVDKIIELRRSLGLPSGLKGDVDIKSENTKELESRNQSQLWFSFQFWSLHALSNTNDSLFCYSEASFEEKVNFVRRIYPITGILKNVKFFFNDIHYSTFDKSRHWSDCDRFFGNS